MKNIKEKYPLLFEDNKNRIEKKYKLAWKTAREISELLKIKYKAKTVYVFGSLTDKKRFHERSDIDIAVSGIPDKKFYKAYGEITGKYKEFDIDLVDIKDCKKSLINIIEEEGIKIE